MSRNEADETVSAVSFIKNKLFGDINGIQLAKFGLLFDWTSSIYFPTLYIAIPHKK